MAIFQIIIQFLLLIHITNTFLEDDILIIRGVAVDIKTIQQSTEILDSNGNEIYEREILQQESIVDGKHYGYGKALIVKSVQNDYQTGWNILRSMKHL